MSARVPVCVYECLCLRERVREEGVTEKLGRYMENEQRRNKDFRIKPAGSWTQNSNSRLEKPAVGSLLLCKKIL